ncbi:hypothetical protein SynTAK9802_01729 [Synechococcus sp. TAK9802]|nr:hypothetical protein SynTAK9802_01729 [Synechococcus sp. TAK9802]
MIPLIAQGLLSLQQARTLPGPVLGNSSLPDAIPIVAQLVGVDDMPTKINDPKPAIARLVLEELIAIDGGDHA